MSPLLSSIDPGDFQPIGEYLERQEYHPNIIGEGTARVKLEGDFSPEEQANEVFRCGVIFTTAKDLGMLGLQDLAFRKLKALSASESLRGGPILDIAETMFENGNTDVKHYLVTYIADHFYQLLAENNRLVRVMQRCTELGTRIHARLGTPQAAAEDVRPEMKIKAETEIGGRVSMSEEEEFQMAIGMSIQEQYNRKKSTREEEERSLARS